MSKIVFVYSAPETSLVIGPPAAFWCALSLRVRSGLITIHERPRSVLWKTTLPPYHAMTFPRGSRHGANAIGDSQLKRYLLVPVIHDSLPVCRYGSADHWSCVTRL